MRHIILLLLLATISAIPQPRVVSPRGGNYSTVSTRSTGTNGGSSFLPPTPTVTNPCGLPSNSYAIQDVPIALRYPVKTETDLELYRPVEDHSDGAELSDSRPSRIQVTPSNNPRLLSDSDSQHGQCLHAGGPISDPNAPGIGLHGGLKVRIVDCSQAKYRWSVKKDGKGVVVGNGLNPLWALNAEDFGEGSDITIREIEQDSDEQSWSFASKGQIKLNAPSGTLCLTASLGDGQVHLADCQTDNKDQLWVVLLLPQPLPTTVLPLSASSTTVANSGVSSNRLPITSGSWVQPSSVTWSMPIGCPMKTNTEPESVGTTILATATTQ